MKKLLFVIDTLRMGGAEKSLVSLLKAIDKNKYDIDLLVFELGGVLESEVPSEVNLLITDPVTRAMTLEFRKYAKDLLVRGRLSAFYARMQMSLKAKNKEENTFNWNVVKKYIPALEENYDTAISYLEGFPAYYVIDKVKADRKIAWIHIDMTNMVMPAKAVSYYSKFDEIATISEICKNAFVRHVPMMRDHIHVIENIVFPDEILTKAEMPADFSTWQNHFVNLVTIGRLDYQKGIDIAIDACSILVNDGIDVCWHEYGTGVLRDELQQKINDLKLNDHFILEGLAVNPYPYMKKADMIIQTSRFEGKSIVLDEAKILGKAIITTGYESVDDQISDQKTGMITMITPESIAHGIEALLNNSELKAALENNLQKEQVPYQRILEKIDRIL